MSMLHVPLAKNDSFVFVAEDAFSMAFVDAMSKHGYKVSKLEAALFAHDESLDGKRVREVFTEALNLWAGHRSVEELLKDEDRLHEEAVKSYQEAVSRRDEAGKSVVLRDYAESLAELGYHTIGKAKRNVSNLLHKYGARSEARRAHHEDKWKEMSARWFDAFAKTYTFIRTHYVTRIWRVFGEPMGYAVRDDAKFSTRHCILLVNGQIFRFMAALVENKPSGGLTEFVNYPGCYIIVADPNKGKTTVATALSEKYGYNMLAAEERTEFAHPNYGDAVETAMHGDKPATIVIDSVQHSVRRGDKDSNTMADGVESSALESISALSSIGRSTGMRFFLTFSLAGVKPDRRDSVKSDMAGYATGVIEPVSVEVTDAGVLPRVRAQRADFLGRAAVEFVIDRAVPVQGVTGTNPVQAASQSAAPGKVTIHSFK